MLLGCKKQKNDAAMAAYEEQLAQFEQIFDAEDIDEQEAEEAIAAVAENMLGIAETSQNVAIRVIEARIHNYFTLEQKQRLFAAVPADTLEAHNLGKAWRRFQAELQTQGGMPMIDIVCATPKGDTLRLADIVAKHEFVLLDFWASWCRPCRELMPELKEIYADHRNKLEIVSISVDSDLEAWKSMIKQLELPWQHGAVQLAREGSEPDEAYGISYIPTLFLIGRDGIIIAREPSHEFILETLNNK